MRRVARTKFGVYMCNMQMPWSVLPMRYATIVPCHANDTLWTADLDVHLLWMQIKRDGSLDLSFLMQMFFLTRMQMRNVYMMQMSHAGVQRQSLSMMVPVHIFKPLCRCLLVGMPWCKCFDTNTIYSKIPFVFKIEASSTPETKNIFKSWFLISRKVIFLFFFFDLRLPKNWWSLLVNLRIGYWLGIWWSAQKIYFHNLIEQKGGTFSRPFSRSTNSLKIKHFKKIHFSSPWIWQFDKRQDPPW